jgi:hypothetical protein
LGFFAASAAFVASAAAFASSRSFFSRARFSAAVSCAVLWRLSSMVRVAIRVVDRVVGQGARQGLPREHRLGLLGAPLRTVLRVRRAPLTRRRRDVLARLTLTAHPDRARRELLPRRDHVSQAVRVVLIRRVLPRLLRHERTDQRLPDRRRIRRHLRKIPRLHPTHARVSDRRVLQLRQVRLREPGHRVLRALPDLSGLLADRLHVLRVLRDLLEVLVIEAADVPGAGPLLTERLALLVLQGRVLLRHRRLRLVREIPLRGG